MDDSTTNPAPDVETTQTAPEVVTEEPELETEVPELESEEDHPEPETEEIDYEGQKFAVPKVLKDAFLRQSDYTQKTQKLADDRKSFDGERETFAKGQKDLEEHIVAVGRLMATDERLAQYDKIDWKQWAAQDPQAAQAAWFEKEQLKENRNSLAGKLHQDWQQKQEASQRETAKQIAEGQAVLAKEIPNWSPQLADELTKYGKSQGLSDKRLGAIVEPAEVKILHKARMYDQLIAKQRQTAAKTTETPAIPVPQVGARRSPASTEPRDSDSPEVWLAKRNAQIARQNRAAGR